MKDNLALIAFFTVCCFDYISCSSDPLKLYGMPRRVPDYPTAEEKKLLFFKNLLKA